MNTFVRSPEQTPLVPTYGCKLADVADLGRVPESHIKRSSGTIDLFERSWERFVRNARKGGAISVSAEKKHDRKEIKMKNI